VVALAVVAAACGGGDDEGGDAATTTADTGAAAGGATTAAAQGPSGELRLLVGRAEEASIEAELKKDIEEFQQAYPDITVKREALENDQLRTILNTRLGGNSAPDIISYDTGPGFGGVLAKNGLIQPIDDAYEKFGWKTYDWARQRATYGGKTYGLPDQVEEVGIYYNKKLFDEWGFGEPKTLEELVAIAEKAKENDITPFAFGDKDQWPAGHQYSMLMSNLLGREGLDEILYGEGKWNTPEGVKAIDIFFKQFNEKGYFPRGVVGLGYEDANALFYAGRAAMLPTGTWLVAEIGRKVKNFEVGFFPFPSIDGSAIAPPAGVGNGLFIPAKAKNREAALAYMDWLQSPERTKKSLTVFNSLPAYPVETEGLQLSQLFTEVLTDLSQGTEGESSFGYNIDVLTPQNFNQVMFQGFQDVLNGRRSPQEQADALQAAWEKAKAAGDTLEKP